MTTSSLAAKKSPERQHQAERASPEPSRQPGPDGPYASIMTLQRAAGNRAVSQFLGSVSSTASSNGGVLQRKCASCALAGGECKECRKEQPALQRASLSPHRRANHLTRSDLLVRERAEGEGAVPPIVHEVLQSSGQSLDPSTRSFMESRFGHDFSHVQVHTDSKAAESARAVSALAYTVGRDVVFGEEQYAPTTSKGQRLLAHELTHVVQQGRSSAMARQMALRDQKTSNVLPLEREADAAAERIEIGPIPHPIGNHSLAAGMILRARDPDASAGGLSTWYVSIGGKAKVFAIQIGQQPDLSKDRVSIRFASLRAEMKNPPVSDRTMVLTILPTKLAPKIVDESETALPDGFSFQKVISIKLNDADENSPVVSILMSYFAGPVDAPFAPKEVGGQAYTKPVNVEQGWLAASDGYREISGVNFKSLYPKESLYAEGAYPMVHPRLGYGFVHPDRGFVPYPHLPLFSAAEKQRFGEEFTRTVVHLLPVAGSLIMIGEALAGKSIFGRRLSTTERVILGAGALLAEVGALVRAGKAAVAASRLSTVAGVSRVEALRMVMASRALTATEAATLERLSAEIKAGRALSEADQVLANRLIGKMSEHLRIAAARAEVEAVTGVARRPERFTNLAKSISKDEERVGQALARDLKADVVRPPEVTVEGVKNPDYVLNDVVAEAYSPRTGNIENLIRGAVAKHRQAGVMVIDVTSSSVPAADVLGSTGRFFGRPEFADVSRIIVVNGDKVIGQALRPAAGSVSPTIIRGAASLASQAGSKEEEKR